MKNSETQSVKGTVKITKISASGEVLETTEHTNMVVNGGKRHLTRAVIYSLYNAIPIFSSPRLYWGTSGTAPTIGDYIITGADSGLNNTDGSSYREAEKIAKFTFNLDTSIANGITIREFGLSLIDETVNIDSDWLFARIAREPIYKTSDFSLHIEWLIEFL